MRGFLLQNLLPGATPAWRIGLTHIAAAIPDLESWPAFPSAARYPGPALFLSGANSDYVLPAHHTAIRALFPAARFIALPGAGHWLHADQPAAFAAAALAFLTGP